MELDEMVTAIATTTIRWSYCLLILNCLLILGRCGGFEFEHAWIWCQFESEQAWVWCAFESESAVKIGFIFLFFCVKTFFKQMTCVTCKNKFSYVALFRCRLKKINFRTWIEATPVEIAISDLWLRKDWSISAASKNNFLAVHITIISIVCYFGQHSAKRSKRSNMCGINKTLKR